MSEQRTLIERLVDEMTGAGFPWVARVYFLLIVLFGAVLIWSAAAAHHVSNDKLADSDLYVRLFTLASDGLKTVLGALLGSLSLAAEAIWKAKSK
ncbi:MAG TPA: hypothetical protein VK513_01480 [Terriglobales bacterium]|jgi:hypothetical protein|nr:hypothetical protein [Terriglobales bacterium]